MLTLFAHPHEDTPANNAIYTEQKQRLSLNSWIILFCLLEGQQLNSVSAFSGLKFAGMNRSRMMTEFRRRISELRENGIELQSELDATGLKTHRIPALKLGELKAKYLPFRNELLIKINK